MKLGYYTTPEDSMVLALESEIVSDAANEELTTLMNIDMKDYYNAAIAAINAAAFGFGWGLRAPEGIVSNYIASVYPEVRKKVFQAIYFKLHETRFTTWVELVDQLFARFYAEQSDAYKAFDKNWNSFVEDPIMDLTKRDVEKIDSFKETYKLFDNALPSIWRNPERFEVPTSATPFKVFHLHKNIVVVTDGAITIKMKPLSDGQHMAVVANYSNGRGANMSQVKMRQRHIPIFNAYEEEPNLFEAPAGMGSINPNVPITLRWGDKKVEFTL